MIVQQFFATTPKNMESLLADELRALGASDVCETRAGASFSANLSTAYRICLWSRIANRILLVLARVPAATPEALYSGVQGIQWAQHFDVNNTFAVEFSISQSDITHSHFGALKTKDAIVDQFREQYGDRPSIQTSNPDIQINIYLFRNEATISLDLSGASLHRRGYREEGATAPLKENLAAAILLRAGWPDIAKQGGTLIDPMCGSGTLLIEAAQIAADIAPGLSRDYWGFQCWKQFVPASWQELIDEATNRRIAGLVNIPDICGYDSNPKTVRIAEENTQQADLKDYINIEQQDIKTCAPASDIKPGLVICNPPYGHRMGAEHGLDTLYSELGNTLKKQFQGWRVAIFTGNAELGKNLGLRAKRIHTLYNGALECKLLHFEVAPEWYFSAQKGPRPLAKDKRSDAAQMFANRLKKNRKHLSRWLKREQIDCYRLYDADLPEYALAIDVYQGIDTDEQPWVHAQEYEAPKSIDESKARLRLRESLGVVLDELGIDEAHLFFKLRRKQKGNTQYQQLDNSKHFHVIRENGCQFQVNFDDYLDTGLFLDQRITRGRLAKMAPGKCFLNLFAYTGAATVYAAKGGAQSTTTVDMSNTYLDWAKRNMVINDFKGDQHEFIQADCLQWLDKTSADSDHQKYGLIFLDPPSFSTSKRMDSTLDIQRDHVDLIKKTASLLTPDGTLIFSNNLRRFKMDREALTGLSVDDISKATLPKDFERNPKIHTCWIIRHIDN